MKPLLLLVIIASLSATPARPVQETLYMSEKMLKEKNSSEWLTYVRKSAVGNIVAAKDAKGKLVVIEWKKTDIQSADLAEFKKSICELACKLIAPVEVEFLKAYPNAVSQELFLKACVPFFEKGSESIDWGMVETTIQSTIKQFYLMDMSSFGPKVIAPLLDDVYFPVTVKDPEDDQLLGFATFAITPALPFGNVKLINIAATPEAAERDLDQLLMSTIFSILPKTERVFLYARPTNNTALKTYYDLGFTRDLSPTQDPNHKINTEYLIPLEYKAEQSSILQELALTLEE
jgi:ribosomal protein S18 acetylase RimI-like enzyme